jgi:hypothetical protein
MFSPLPFRSLNMSSWVWDHFKKSGGKAVCTVRLANGQPCGQALEWKQSTTSLAYHLTNVHDLQRGAPVPNQKKMKFGPPSCSTPWVLNQKEILCATWAANGLSYDLIEDNLFRKCFGSIIPPGFGRCVPIPMAKIPRVFSPRQELSREMVDFAGRMKSKFLERLKGQNITIAIDGGKVHKKLQTICVLMEGKAFFWKSTPVLHNDHQTILCPLNEIPPPFFMRVFWVMVRSIKGGQIVLPAI